MIVVVFEANKKNKKCFKFANDFERIDDVIFTRGDDVTFKNWSEELEDYITHSQICDDDDLELFGVCRICNAGLRGRVIKSIALTKDTCVEFGLKHCSCS
jgi:hypothetical protein